MCAKVCENVQFKFLNPLNELFFQKISCDYKNKSAPSKTRTSNLMITSPPSYHCAIGSHMFRKSNYIIDCNALACSYLAQNS